MNTTKIAVIMFGTAAASLFLANFHLRHELISLNSAIKERADYIIADRPEVTIIADMPVAKAIDKPVLPPNVEFSIQVCTSRAPIPLNSARFKGLGNVKEEYAHGVYKYTAGSFSSPGLATPLFAKLEDKGYHDAFLVAFKNGKQIDVKLAMKEIKSTNVSRQ